MPRPASQVTIASYYPPSGSTVSIDTIPFIVFSAPVNSSSIVFNIKDSSNVSIISSAPSYNSGIFTYALVPNQSLDNSRMYNSVFASGLDITGTGLITGLSWPFYTENRGRMNIGCWGWGASC